MKTEYNYMKLSTIAVLIMSFCIVAYSSMPNAFANPDPSLTASPFDITPGLQVTVDFRGSISATHEANEIAVYGIDVEDYDNNMCVIDGDGVVRPGDTVGPNTLSVDTEAWLLVASDGVTPVRVWVGSSSDAINAPFPRLGLFPLTILGNAKATVDGTTPTSTHGLTSLDTPPQVRWLSLSTPQTSPNTDATGFTLPHIMGMMSCGKEPAGDPDPSTRFEVVGKFRIVQPVGGEILSIDATSLVLAGMFANSIWIVPTIGALAGTGIAMYKLRLKQ